MPSAQDMPPVVKLAKQLYLERMEELKAQIKADEESFRKLVTEIDEIRSGKWDSKLKELFPEVSEPTPMEITNDSQVPDDNSLTTETGEPEVIIHQASAVPDITIPASEEKIEVKAEVEEKPLDTKSPNVPTLVSEAALTVVESNSNATPLESNTVLADAVALVTTDSSVASNETTLPTPDVNEINGTILTPSNPSSNDVAKPSVDTVIEEQKPSIPEVSAQTIEEKEILSEIEPTPQVTEILAPTAEVTPAVTPKESEIKQDISIKRKPDDIDMMSVDNSPKRARTQSRSPSVTAEPTIEAMSPAIETPHAETPVAETPGTGADHAPAETPDRKEETPVAAVEEVQGKAMMILDIMLI
jgi:bromodomain-containing protein 8